MPLVFRAPEDEVPIGHGTENLFRIIRNISLELNSSARP